jgi:hypothetical protein
MGTKNDLTPVFAKLKAIFAPYAKKMDVVTDTRTDYWLNTRHLMKNRKPLAFGGVRLGKNYVSFHLMSVYAAPGDIQTISPELKKRMQGKSCFNFKVVDEELFRELAELTRSGAARFADGKFIDNLRKLQSGGRQ